MKYATLLLGAVLVLASIVAGRADMSANCPSTNPLGIEIEIYKIMEPTCPDEENCRSFKFVGYKITGVPLHGADLRVKTKTPRRGVSTLGPEIVAVTLDGKRCQIGD